MTFKHGLSGYKKHNCPCDVCLKANADWQRDYKADRKANGLRTVDAGPTRERIFALHAMGMSVETIATRTGYGTATVTCIPQRKRVTREFAEAIAALPMPTAADILPGVRVSATPTRNRLRALRSLGWSTDALSRMSGIWTNTIRSIDEQASVEVATRDRVAAMYDRLWNTRPIGNTPAERSGITLARKYAAERGWPMPMDLGENGLLLDAGKRSAGADLDEFLFLIESGEEPHSAAARLGVKRDAIENAARRQGRDDVLDRIHPGRLVAAA